MRRLFWRLFHLFKRFSRWPLTKQQPSTHNKRQRRAQNVQSESAVTWPMRAVHAERCHRDNARLALISSTVTIIWQSRNTVISPVVRFANWRG